MMRQRMATSTMQNIWIPRVVLLKRPPRRLADGDGQALDGLLDARPHVRQRRAEEPGRPARSRGRSEPVASGVPSAPVRAEEPSGRASSCRATDAATVTTVHAT
ncbi:unnamed protein product [Prorocentrum cordatum]|uniref:Uncharacterized protein n=1 Tax=Prorocentrum cordatum TaxID=2364126 RepID=A0ABN9RKU9_9DINO|nr:unnamed protein product [Polarella glacialis]